MRAAEYQTTRQDGHPFPEETERWFEPTLVHYAVASRSVEMESEASPLVITTERLPTGSPYERLRRIDERHLATTYAFGSTDNLGLATVVRYELATHCNPMSKSKKLENRQQRRVGGLSTKEAKVS